MLYQRNGKWLMMDVKATLFFIIICFLSSVAGAQCFQTETIYNLVRKADNNQQSLQKRLTALYALKAKAEACRQTKDSGYLLILHKIAYLELGNHRYDSSIVFTRNAINISKLSGVSLSSLADDYDNLASFYFMAQYYNNALACYDTAVMIKETSHHNPFLVVERYYRTVCYFNLGDYQRAVDESNTGIMSMSTKEDSAYYLFFLNYRGQSLLFEDRYREALVDADTAIFLATKKNNRYELASAYKIKAMILGKEKNIAEAEMLFKKAIAERLFTEKSAQIASDYNDLGNLYANNLLKYKQAQNCYQKAITYAEKVADPRQRSRKLFMAYTNLASSFAVEGNLSEAVSCYRKAISSANIPLPDFLHANPSLRQLEVLENKDLVWSLLTGKTELLLQLFKQTHQPVYLTSCLQTAKLTDSFVTQIRHEHVTEESKLHWRDKTHNFFSDAVEVCYLLHDAEHAFFFMEKSRAVLLNDKLNELGAAAHLPHQDSAKEEDLQAQSAAQQQILTSLSASQKERAVAQFRFLQVKAEQERYIKSLEKKYPVFYQYKYDDAVPSLSSLQAYLTKNNQSFISYFKTDSAMYALAVSKNKTSFIKITSGDFDSQNLSGFIRLCNDKQATNNNYDAYLRLSQTIYTRLFKPLRLTKGSVAICTDNFFIPFEALCTDDKRNRFLLYDYSFSYVYSARSLMKPFANNKAIGLFIGFAPVSFSSASGLVDLKGSASALQQSAECYVNPALFTEEQATRKNFFNNISHYSVVTIFSHAQADTTNAEPILYLSDSLIRLSELQRLDAPSVQLVILSACQTNTGRNATGEGIYSLARGFAAAGVPSVSATLWKADEETVYRISAKFNEYLAQGMNKSEALQKAKVWYLQNSNREHTLPYYWANMVLIGTSQPITLTASNPWWYWVAAIAGFVLTCFFLFRYYKHRQHKT